ncbi:MAG: rplT [Haloplasmataceae bacterium]|jgi:large subunit ribosomal protein L20|nr:rplT [Haloplasmataceae bacterium]
MPRVKGGYTTRRRRKKTLKLAKGYFGSKHILYKTAHEQVMKSLSYAYRDRKTTKRNFRKLWITRINAACRFSKMSYSQFMHGLKLANIEVNRKMLADLAVNDLNGFNQLVGMAKDAIANPAKYVVVEKVEVEAKKEVKVIKAEPVAEVKKEVKVAPVAEVKKEVKVEPVVVAPVATETKDLTKLTVAELKEIAKERGINLPAKVLKADIIALLA